MIFYRIYQFLIMMPLLLVATFIAATLTIIGSVAGFGRTMLLARKDMGTGLLFAQLGKG